MSEDTSTSTPVATNDRGDAAGIRSITRALAILRAMNRRQSWMLQDLQTEVDLPKTTLFRILRTLVSEGYVRAEGDTGRYRLAAKARELGGGYTEKSLVVDLGAPIALRITKTIKWPLAIATLDGDALVVRFSTMPYSPVAVHATTLGQRLGLLETAMGRAYLAHCERTEQDILLERVLGAQQGSDDIACRVLRQELAQVARLRHAVRLPNWQRTSATIAVPIRCDAQVLAALSLTTFGRSMTPQLVARYLPVLEAAAEEIATACVREHLTPTGI